MHHVRILYTTESWIDCHPHLNSSAPPHTQAHHSFWGHPQLWEVFWICHQRTARTCTTNSPCVDLGVQSWNSYTTQYFVPEPTDSSRASEVSCECIVAVAVSDIASECPAALLLTLAAVPGRGGGWRPLHVRAGPPAIVAWLCKPAPGGAV